MSTIEEGTDEYYATLLANTLKTEPYELPISTAFGVLDPAFGFETPLKAAQNAARFIPEISIQDVSSKLEVDGSLGVNIIFVTKD